ncbi:hypothetical protein TNIN_390411 [Trichonephila inaurata madagascariensis]|uniref:Uncharacterized protein n=1 Tax=Trichonephila inaurata madagascariensis TaxID=2747483 RepID=A0A8X7CKX3_9ARAC|nr:hypothetical protein TNIN_390411 [Trichonephila inaurata madagascariensis]
MVDEDRNGRPVLIAAKSTEQQLEEFIRADRRVTINSITTAIGCLHSLACSIMHDRLNFRKVEIGVPQFAVYELSRRFESDCTKDHPCRIVEVLAH